MTVTGFLNTSAAVLRYAQEAGGGPRRRLHRFVARVGRSTSMTGRDRRS